MAFPSRRFTGVGATPDEVAELEAFWGAECTRFDPLPDSALAEQLKEWRARGDDTPMPIPEVEPEQPGAGPDPVDEAEEAASGNGGKSAAKARAGAS